MMGSIAFAAPRMGVYNNKVPIRTRVIYAIYCPLEIVVKARRKAAASGAWGTGGEGGEKAFKAKWAEVFGGEFSMFARGD